GMTLKNSKRNYSMKSESTAPIRENTDMNRGRGSKVMRSQVARHIRRHTPKSTCERHVAVQENRRTDVLQIRGHPKADGGRRRWRIAPAKSGKIAGKTRNPPSVLQR